MSRLFGTDGVRGVANTELSSELAYHLGQAAVVFLGDTIVIGKDTRRSGDMLEAAVVAGVTSAGGVALCASIVPTPAVALLVRKTGSAAGIVISASHNPPQYNGIKIFDADGFKLTDELEEGIEAFVDGGGLEGACSRTGDAGERPEMPQGGDVGRRVDLDTAREIYISHAVDSVIDEGIDFNGMKIVLDVAHGASTFTSPEAFRRLGADLVVINEDFDGCDINVQCGSTHLEPLRAAVARCGADVGIAHDGDADRVQMITSTGDVIDGDVIEAVCALDMKSRGLLAMNTVVTTVMCNIGFVRAMRDAGIDVVQTSVGDRHVLEYMRAHGLSIGGEQSGHMILLEHNSTGDGLMTAVQFLAAVRRSGKPLEEVVKVMTRFPQCLLNVSVHDKQTASEDPDVVAAVASASEALGQDGRVLLRPSGTEPIVRVMVEAADEQTARRYAAEIADVVALADGVDAPEAI